MVVYSVWENEDMTEGRGPMRLLQIFADEDTAWEYADLRPGVMGRIPQSGSWRTEKYRDVGVRPHQVRESIHDAEEAAKELLRQSALRKLTAEEKLALGVKE